MARHGEPIRNVYLSGGVDPDISYAMPFVEWEAANAAGLSLWDWECGRYSKDFKVRVIAWYNLHQLVQSHIEDAAAKARPTK